MIDDTNGIKSILFGEGTLRVSSGTIGTIEGGKEGIFMIFPGDPEPVGTEHMECVGKKDIDEGVDTRLIFSTVDSVNMVIEYLEAIKSEMAEEI